MGGPFFAAGRRPGPAIGGELPVYKYFFNIPHPKAGEIDKRGGLLYSSGVNFEQKGERILC